MLSGVFFLTSLQIKFQPQNKIFYYNIFWIIKDFLIKFASITNNFYQKNKNKLLEKIL